MFSYLIIYEVVGYMPKKKKETSVETELKYNTDAIITNRTAINDIKDNYKRKTSFTGAVVKTGLAGVAIACITLGMTLAETNITNGSILIGIGAVLFILNYYFG